jgi:HK97 family phage portal protein
MGFLDRFRAPAETKESAAHRLHTQLVSLGQPAWSKRDYSAFAKEGYVQNVVAYQAINKIAESIASVEWTAFNGDTEVTEAPMLDLVRTPNPFQTSEQFFMEYVGFLMISGNGYRETISVGDDVREMYALRPDRMKIIPSANGRPAKYCYEVNGRKTFFDADPKTGASDIQHLKLFNPVDDWYGLAPTEAAAYSIDVHNASMGWMQALLQNSARPSGALVVEGDEQLSDEQFARLKAQTEDQYSGAQNAGRPMLLEGGMKWQQMGLSPTDMGIIDSKNASARDICLAWGVPPQLLGIPGDNTYSNYSEARLSFWEDTVLPLLGLIAGDLSRKLGNGLELRPDLEKIPAIVDRRAKLWEMTEATNSLTVNEKREAMGYPPINGGDVLLVPSMQIPLGEASAGLGSEPEMSEPELKALIRAAGYEA